jgi:hypothetical protein
MANGIADYLKADKEVYENPEKYFDQVIEIGDIRLVMFAVVVLKGFLRHMRLQRIHRVRQWGERVFHVFLLKVMVGDAAVKQSSLVGNPQSFNCACALLVKVVRRGRI